MGCPLICVLGLWLFGAPPAECADVLAGSWWVNGNGHAGALVLKVAPDGTISGTIYGQRLVGTYDAKTKQVSFQRLRELKGGKDAAGVQLWTGVLSQVANKQPSRYTLEGTFKSIAGPHWGQPGVEYAWKAEATRLLSPAEDLQELQGRWEVAGIIPCINKDCKLPAETRLHDKSSALVIRGNQLTWEGKTVATLANDVPSKALNAEIGFRDFRLLMLTLPDGKGLLCSYSLRDDGVEIAYPHTTSCHRGSGQIVYLRRPAN